MPAAHMAARAARGIGDAWTRGHSFGIRHWIPPGKEEQPFFNFLKITILINSLRLEFINIQFKKRSPCKKKMHNQTLSKEAPRAHVATFYSRLRLIPSVLRVSKNSILKLIENVNLLVCKGPSPPFDSEGEGRENFVATDYSFTA